MHLILGRVLIKRGDRVRVRTDREVEAMIAKREIAGTIAE